MKYKINDKVRIKTWDDMKNEYGLDAEGNVKCLFYYLFLEAREIMLNDNCPDRILTIKRVSDCDKYYNKFYEMKEIDWAWEDYMIEGLYVEQILDPINSRFEILDI